MCSFWNKHRGEDPENASGTNDERVRVYDFDTKTVSLLPASELAPGMVHARMDGIDGAVWVDGARLTLNAFRHPPFSEDVRNYLRQIKAALDEVYPMTMEAWEDGFRRDSNAEREIAHWLHFAAVYSRLTTQGDVLGASLQRRQEVFRVLIGCGIAPREQVLMVVERGSLSRDEAERIIASFFGPAKGS